MDERRHNMDGALFVDDERAQPQDDDRGRRTREAGRPRTSGRSGYDDGKADAARRITQGILDRMDLEASVHVREDDEQVVLDIDGPDAGRAIGKKGMTLEALQFLVNKIVNREPDERRHIVLDSGDYRERHDNGLVSMAKREAKRAISSGRPVTLEPMSARDRRVIHVSLAKFPGISTRSEGEGMERRLQIIPARDRGERGERSERDDRPARARDDRGDRPARDGRERRDDRPRDDRPRDDRPRDDVSERSARDDRARDERPARDDRAREERPARDDRARDERPARDDRARDERAARDDRARDERPARDDRAREERAPRDRPSDRPRDDRQASSRDDRPSDRPRDDRPNDRPRDDRPSDRPRDDRAGLVERARDDRARSTRDDRVRQPSRDRDR